MGEKVPLPLRSLQQRTMGSSCTMGITTTSRLSCTRAMSVLAMTQAATPAQLSTGRNSSGCQPSLGGHARMWGSWAKNYTDLADQKKKKRPSGLLSPAYLDLRLHGTHISPSHLTSEAAPNWGRNSLQKFPPLLGLRKGEQQASGQSPHSPLERFVSLGSSGWVDGLSGMCLARIFLRPTPRVGYPHLFPVLRPSTMGSSTLSSWSPLTRW